MTNAFSDIVSSFSIFSPIFLGLENPFSKSLYIEMNERIEKISKILYFTIIKVTLPALMIPNLVVSFFLYFSTDLENEAFILPFPIW